MALAVVALLTVHVSLAVRSLVRENPTVDEVIHLPAGLTYWQTRSFRLYPHNPPLVKLVAALPLLARPPAVEYANPAWDWAAYFPNKAAFAHLFMRANSADYFEMFTRARLLMPAFSVVGGLVVFFWSRSLYGDLGGLLSLALWAFCPNILAHTRLVTTDVGATAIGALATYAFWRYLKSPSARLAALAGACLGLAQLTKFSLLLLYLLWPLIALADLIAATDRPRRALRFLGHGTLVVALSVLVIDLGYGCEGVGIPLGDYHFTCATLTKPKPPGVPAPRSEDKLLDGAWRYRVNRFLGTPLAAIPTPLPKYYLLGFDAQKLEAEGVPLKFLAPNVGGPEGDEVQGYPVYLDGRLRQKSWWYYYLFTLAYKVPEGTWLLVVTSLLALAASPRSRNGWFDESTVLLTPMVVLGVMSVLTNINLGLRYVLPIFPYLYISAGKLAPWAAGLTKPAARGAGVALVATGLTMTAAATLWVHPHYLAYFNALSGGPTRGGEHLIDSNIDWGQDLVGLHRWMQANAPGESVGLAYFGQISPQIFNDRGEPLDWFLPPPRPGTVEPANMPPRYRYDPNPVRLKPGLYAVSVSLVKGLPWRVYDAPWGAFGRGDYRFYSAGFHAFSYFDALKPVARIGDSIFVYRVTPEQADRISSDLWPGPRVRP